MESECELAVTSGLGGNFTVPFDCNLELFAAERTNVEAFSCICNIL